MQQVLRSCYKGQTLVFKLVIDSITKKNFLTSLHTFEFLQFSRERKIFSRRETKKERKIVIREGERIFKKEKYPQCTRIVVKSSSKKMNWQSKNFSFKWDQRSYTISFLQNYISVRYRQFSTAIGRVMLILYYTTTYESSPVICQRFANNGSFYMSWRVSRGAAFALWKVAFKSLTNIRAQLV